MRIPSLHILSSSASFKQMPSLGHNAQERGLFLEMSQFNHACNPNAQATWNGSIGQETLHALRDIEDGEEITISYLGSLMLRKERQK